MKTIAMSIDEETLTAIDQLAAGSLGVAKKRSRSEIMRAALREYVSRQRLARREHLEKEIFAKHRNKLDKELSALVDEQAKL